MQQLFGRDEIGAKFPLNWKADEMNKGGDTSRKKLLHQQGVVATAKYVPEANPYTGVF